MAANGLTITESMKPMKDRVGTKNGGGRVPLAVESQTAPSLDVLLARMQQLEAENAANKAKLLKIAEDKAAKQKISCRVSEKGAVSLYGLGRFPVTLYREQMERLLAHKDAILDFIGENAASLSVKD